MNERIKVLLDQCTNPELTKPWPLIDTDKFAELIVKECVKAVKPDTEYPMESVDVVEEFHRGYWVGCNDSTMRIKQHFGVKE
jgi:hypothetical protein